MIFYNLVDKFGGYRLDLMATVNKYKNFYKN